MLRWSGALIGRAEERTSSSVFDEKLQENETLERYYTTIHLAVYSAVELKIRRCLVPSRYCSSTNTVDTFSRKGAQETAKQNKRGTAGSVLEK